MKQSAVFVLLVLMLLPFATYAEKIQVNIKGIRNLKGTIRIAVFKDNESFKREEPFKTIEVKKRGLFKGSLNCSFDLPTGIFALALLDDENDNELMDKSFFGIPEEGFGFSNYEHTGIFAPVFNDFKFFVKKGINKIKMTLKYL